MDKSVLFKDRLQEADVKVPGVGTVRVRALTRAEVLLVRKATDSENMDGDRILVLEKKLIAKAMVDPVLTESEVGQWQNKATADELDPVLTKIQELSGLLPGASKSGVS